MYFLVIIGVLTFMSLINFMLSSVEHENSFITSGLSCFAFFVLLLSCEIHILILRPVIFQSK